MAKQCYTKIKTSTRTDYYDKQRKNLLFHRVQELNRLNQCFIGQIEKTVIALIEKGVIYYECGGTLAMVTVFELKKTYTQMKLIMVLSCPEQAPP